MIYEILMRIQNDHVMATHLDHGVPNCQVWGADFPEGAIVIKIPFHYVGADKVPTCFQVLDVVEVIDEWRFKGRLLVELPAKEPIDPLALPILDIFKRTTEATR